jgi:zinc transport system permease protein
VTISVTVSTTLNSAVVQVSGVVGQLPLPYPFETRSMQYALLAGIPLGLAAPLLGAFLVERRMSLMGDGIGHVAFAGVSVGLATGRSPLIVAFVVAALGAVLLEWLRSTGRAAGDLALAVLLYSGLAGGVVIAGLAGSYNASVLSYLFGSILTVEPQEAVVVAVISVLIASVVALQWRRLLAVVSDADFARTVGVKVRVADMTIAVGTAMVIVGAMRAVGLLLVSSMMVLPVGAVRMVSRSFASTLVVSALLGALCVVVGLTVSSVQGDLPPGGTIVLVGVAAVAIAAVVSSVRR